MCMTTGRFAEDAVLFELLRQLYADMQEVYEGDAKTKVLRRLSYYPLGTIELKEYSEDNAVFHSLIYKIQPEYSGGVFREIHLDAEGKEISNQTWYKGID